MNTERVRILLDAIPLTGLLTGISRYLRNLYSEMEKLPEVEVYYFNGKRVSRRMPAQAEPISWARKTDRVWRLHESAVLAMRTAHWLLYEYKVRRRTECNNYNVHHETAFTPAAQRNCCQVFTIHDLSLMRYPEMHPKERVKYSDLLFKRRIGYANHIITVSEFIKGEIIEYLNISPDRITVIPEAADKVFYPRQKGTVESVLKRLRIPTDYMLFVGTIEPRKNLPRLVAALQNCKNNIPLVLAGWEGWGNKEWIGSKNNRIEKNKLYPLGYVDEETLACLYSGARCFVYPSLYEGFGLPVLEAMACGTPVICSNAASLPEVAGEAAILVPPQDLDGFTKAIDLLWNDCDLRMHKVQDGYRHSKSFSWAKAARRTLNLFKQIAPE